MKYLIVLLSFIFAISCSDEMSIIPSQNLSKVSIENGRFKKANGESFFPWGFNYTNPVNVGLIEDNWMDENIWKTIRSDFMEMKALGANVVRIHLQFHQFMLDAAKPNLTNLDRLENLVRLAEEQSLYLDITGLAAYRIEDQPDFYSKMTDEERWHTQKIFWESVADRVGGSDAVFAYNLMNEPVVSVGCSTNSNCEWLPGSSFGGFFFVQNITRTTGIDYLSTMKNWIAEMTESIRAKDKITLITVGFLDLGNYNRFSSDLDYLSPHTYPKSGEIQEAIDHVMDNQSDVPLVIEETANLMCNIEELEEFLEGIDGKYNGLMGHYFGQTLDEVDDGTISGALRKNFLEFFINKNPN